MQLVTSKAQIKTNIATLEVARGKPHESLIYKEYAGLVSKGRCMIAYAGSEGLNFAPSRFVGYVSNTMKTHRSVKAERDGRLTNVAVSKALGVLLVEDDEIDQHFKNFCSRIRNGLPLKVRNETRKYWITDEIESFTVLGETASIEADATLPETVKKALIDARIGQGKYRRQLEKYWGGKCAVTRTGPVEVLRASHIRPWRNSDNGSRLDVFNGLLLSPNIDSLFDLGLITFNSAGSLVASAMLSRKQQSALLPASIEQVPLTPKHEAYLIFHRQYIFQC